MNSNQRALKYTLPALVVAGLFVLAVLGICPAKIQQDLSWESIKGQAALDSTNSTAQAPLPVRPGDGLPANGQVDHDSNLPRGVFVRKSAPLATLLRAVRISNAWLHRSPATGLPGQGFLPRTSLRVLYCTWLT